jgi:hypothetical protein
VDEGCTVVVCHYAGPSDDDAAIEAAGSAVAAAAAADMYAYEYGSTMPLATADGKSAMKRLSRRLLHEESSSSVEGKCTRCTHDDMHAWVVVHTNGKRSMCQ